ncbi:hypothetical protein FB446DRAFT_739824 [Lentinula raphanica]|nr:hypothetical protein FB446DRAFT_739824 [Lentinula raphanica]
MISYLNWGAMCLFMVYCYFVVIYYLASLPLAMVSLYLHSHTHLYLFYLMYILLYLPLSSDM